jgi:hypothetical protein
MCPCSTPRGIYFRNSCFVFSVKEELNWPSTPTTEPENSFETCVHFYQTTQWIVS